jgi:predicted dehydrogenase
MESTNNNKKIRYAIVGAGDIAQEAILPAFEHAENSELVTIVSGDEDKREELGKRYGLRKTYAYEQFDECLKSGDIDAVYIALPNHLHRTYAERAAKAGMHILCEKPLAPSEEDCRKIIDAAKAGKVRLMVAYRLHFDPVNLEAIRLSESGRLGDLRIFDSTFSQQVEAGNVRLTATVDQGGGPLFDMGVYCVNAARYLFRDEPEEVFAFRGNNGEKRFEKTEEMVSVLLRFPHDRIANFTASFGAASTGRYSLVGTKGVLTLDPAYSYAKDTRLKVTADENTNEQIFPKHDQFAPELIYFSDCILNNREPEPSGEEGLIDVQIIRAAYESIESKRSVKIKSAKRADRPEPGQKIERPPVEEPELVHARPPSPEKKKK